MKVNESKTDLCLFHRGDSAPITLNLYGKTIKSNKSINILGVIFDSKLQWAEHVAHALKKSMKALNAIRLIKRFFTHKELLGLITSNFFSILYYNAEIWQLPSLKSTLKQKLLSASARALRVSTKVIDFYQSFNMLHTSCKRALPEMFMKYKLALCLYKLYNESFNSIEFAQLNFNQVLTGRQENFKIIRNNVYKVGLNSLSNRLHFINDQIPLNWLNCSFGTYKIRCKSLFLSF